MSEKNSYISENWVQWVSLLTLTTCTDCRKLHGKLFAINNVYFKPPLHENCQCEIDEVIALLAGTATNNGKYGADWYLMYYNELPYYYISRNQAEESGWESKKGNLAEILPNMMIGGDIFKNTKGLLPDLPDRLWYEADINYADGYRNYERILYSNDGLIFVTYDHYQTFIEIIKKENNNG